MKPPKVLFIDWFNTLSTGVYWHQFSDPTHLHYGALPLIKQCLFRPDTEITNAWMRGEISYPEIVEVVAAATKIPSNVLTGLLLESCQQLTFEQPEVTKIIEAIRQVGTRVVLATDNMDVFCSHTVPHLGLNDIFDDVLSSNQLGVLKSDLLGNKIQFFDSYLEKHGFSYSDSLLIDDSSTMLLEYNQVGFNRIKVDRPSTTYKLLTSMTL